VGVVALAACAGGWYALRGGSKGEAKGASIADLATVSLLSFDITTTATGDLQAKNQTVLRSELESESTIAELAAEGSFVHVAICSYA
jgi:multidrug efflux pump subunit AcrA (membrane-fusion protein)